MYKECVWKRGIEKVFCGGGSDRPMVGVHGAPCPFFTHLQPFLFWKWSLEYDDGELPYDQYIHDTMPMHGKLIHASNPWLEYAGNQPQGCTTSYISSDQAMVETLFAHLERAKFDSCFGCYISMLYNRTNMPLECFLFGGFMSYACNASDSPKDLFLLQCQKCAFDPPPR